MTGTFEEFTKLLANYLEYEKQIEKLNRSKRSFFVGKEKAREIDEEIKALEPIKNDVLQKISAYRLNPLENISLAGQIQINDELEANEQITRTLKETMQLMPENTKNIETVIRSNEKRNEELKNNLTQESKKISKKLQEKVRPLLPLQKSKLDLANLLPEIQLNYLKNKTIPKELVERIEYELKTYTKEKVKAEKTYEQQKSASKLKGIDAKRTLDSITSKFQQLKAERIPKIRTEQEKQQIENEIETLSKVREEAIEDYNESKIEIEKLINPNEINEIISEGIKETETLGQEMQDLNEKFVQQLEQYNTSMEELTGNMPEKVEENTAQEGIQQFEVIPEEIDIDALEKENQEKNEAFIQTIENYKSLSDVKMPAIEEINEQPIAPKISLEKTTKQEETDREKMLDQIMQEYEAKPKKDTGNLTAEQIIQDYDRTHNNEQELDKILREYDEKNKKEQITQQPEINGIESIDLPTQEEIDNTLRPVMEEYEQPEANIENIYNPTPFEQNPANNIYNPTPFEQSPANNIYNPTPFENQQNNMYNPAAAAYQNPTSDYQQVITRRSTEEERANAFKDYTMSNSKLDQLERYGTYNPNMSYEYNYEQEQSHGRRR